MANHRKDSDVPLLQPSLWALCCKNHLCYGDARWRRCVKCNCLIYFEKEDDVPEGG